MYGRRKAWKKWMKGQMQEGQNVWKQKRAGAEGSSSIVQGCRSGPGAAVPCCHCTQALPPSSHRTDPPFPFPLPQTPFPDWSVPPEPSLLQLEGIPTPGELRESSECFISSGHVEKLGILVWNCFKSCCATEPPGLWP